MRVLVVEHEKQLAAGLRDGLEAEGRRAPYSPNMSDGSTGSIPRMASIRSTASSR